VEELRKRYGIGTSPVVLLYTRFFEFSTERALTIIQGVLARVPRAQWLIVGQGLFGEERELLTLASERGIAESITYAGWVPPDRLPAHFALAQAAIYPLDDTLINRTKCPAKLIDLLGAGVPVVAESVGQSREYIEDGISGLLVPSGDTDGFVGATVRLLRNTELAVRLSTAGKERIRSRYAWRTLVEKVESAYTQPAPAA
jgi:glycosyltransferase involved in cell wall biosynthesis